VNPCSVGFHSLAQVGLRVRARRTHPCRQSFKFRWIIQCRLQRLIKASDQSLQIDRGGGSSFNANLLALVGQLRLVAGRASQAGVFAGRPALDGRRNRCLADADRHRILVIPVCGLWEKTMGPAVRVGSEQLLAAGDFGFRKTSYQMIAEPCEKL
jgi:hypothetical protein